MIRYTDREQTRTYRAEQYWLRDEKRDLGLLSRSEDVRRFLADKAVPPALIARTEVQPFYQATTAEGRLTFLGYDRWLIEVALPAHPLTALHEAAHLLVEAQGGRELHDEDFRMTLIWLIKLHYGTRASERLAWKYHEEGL